MSIMKSFTLSEIEELFKIPQHVLIHLCEKQVVIPEIQQSTGRGNFRRFSEDNIFGFAVALELKKYQIPLAVIKALLIVLSATCKKISSSTNIESLISNFRHLQADLYIFEGTYIALEFTSIHDNRQASNSEKSRIFGIDLSGLLKKEHPSINLDHHSKLPDSYASYLKVGLSDIASCISSQVH